MPINSRSSIFELANQVIHIGCEGKLVRTTNGISLSDLAGCLSVMVASLAVLLLSIASRSGHMQISMSRQVPY